MKTLHPLRIAIGSILLIMVFILLGGSPSWAAESDAGWRPVYDLVMRWVNFAILVALVIKFGREPIMNFLRGSKAAQAKEIQKIESEKARAFEELNHALEQIEERYSRITGLKEKIVAGGEREKQRILADAKREGELLVIGAQQKIVHKLYLARQRFRAEMVDMAVAFAMEALPDKITAEDNQQLVDRWLTSAGSFSAF
jgi:F-type H+-transporting ATPase subunit b